MRAPAYRDQAPLIVHQLSLLLHWLFHIRENFLNHPLVLVLYKAWATNPFGVAAPIFIIALVHMIFDFFALKNDIRFVKLEPYIYFGDGGFYLSFNSNALSLSL